MKPTGKLKIAMMTIIVIILSCGTANAQHWRRHYRPHRVVTVVSRPARTVHVTNSFTQKERFGMAMAYLKNYGYLTVKKYAKMRAVRLLVPYLIYMTIDFLFFNHLHNLNRIIHYLYGGRFINGVYWYITSLYIALVAAVILLDKLNKKQLIAIGVVGGVQR